MRPSPPFPVPSWPSWPSWVWLRGYDAFLGIPLHLSRRGCLPLPLHISCLRQSRDLHRRPTPRPRAKKFHVWEPFDPSRPSAPARPARPAGPCCVLRCCLLPGMPGMPGMPGLRRAEGEGHFVGLELRSHCSPPHSPRVLAPRDAAGRRWRRRCCRPRRPGQAWLDRLSEPVPSNSQCAQCGDERPPLASARGPRTRRSGRSAPPAAERRRRLPLAALISSLARRSPSPPRARGPATATRGPRACWSRPKSPVRPSPGPHPPPPSLLGFHYSCPRRHSANPFTKS